MVNLFWYEVLLMILQQVSRLMDLIVNSLYSNKEVFLRELIRHVKLSFDLFMYRYSLSFVYVASFLYVVFCSYFERERESQIFC